MTLKEWFALNPKISKYCYSDNQYTVYSTKPELWDLSDYRVDCIYPSENVKTIPHCVVLIKR